MPFKQRLKIFAIGFLAGCALVMVILKNRNAGEREREVPATAEARRDAAVPGLRKVYEDRRMPLESRFIVEDASRMTQERGVRLRSLILEGEFSGQKLRVEEWIRGDEVIAWAVMAPDELILTLQPGVSTSQLTGPLHKLGIRMLRRGGAEDTVIVALADSRLNAVPDAIAQLADLSGLVRGAQPNYLDKSSQ